MHILGLIPARGGSKGIPRKNLVRLAGKPLIAYTVEAAKGSKQLTRVIVSTEDQEIADTAKALGVEVPFMRPAHLAADETPMLDVLLDALSTLQRTENYRPDIVVLLQPTSPLRRSVDIDAAVELLQSSGAHTVVTVMAVPHQFTPSSLIRMEGNKVWPWGDGQAPLRRQDKPLLYARNGPAVVAVRTNVLLAEGSLYGKDTRGLVMSREHSLDIDEPFDLELAERLLAFPVDTTGPRKE